MTSIEAGITRAAPTPWIARPAMRTSAPVATAAVKQPATKTPHPIMKVRVRPITSPNRPPASANAAAVTR